MESFAICSILFVGIWSQGLCTLKFQENNIELIRGQCIGVTLESSRASLENETIQLSAEFSETVNVYPSEIKVHPNESNWNIRVCGVSGGFTTVIATEISNGTKNICYLPVTVSNFKFLKWVSDVSGWIYFFAWSLSFYPQMYTDYVRKSVIGLNFDLVALNLVGYILYSSFNCGLYYVQSVRTEYFEHHPHGLNPVQFNDVVFSLHALVSQLVIIYQILIYDDLFDFSRKSFGKLILNYVPDSYLVLQLMQSSRGNQRVSYVTKSIIGVYGIVLAIGGGLMAKHTMTWLGFLYWCSYIKLTVTMIKYIPQVYLNYTRKSTEGWSIGSIWFDILGGMSSILQMTVNSYNFDDWDSLFGDPTKFGLGVFSMAFDIIFIYQHYILYRVVHYEEQVDENSDAGSEANDAVEDNNSRSLGSASYPPIEASC